MCIGSPIKMLKSINPFRYPLRRLLVWMAVVGVLGVETRAVPNCWGQLAPDQAAPAFTLSDLQGRRHDLTEVRGGELVILFFCDLDSSSNRTALSRANALLESYRDLNVRAFAVTSSSAERANTFTRETPISFPLLVDDAGVIDSYHSHLILPMVYLLNRELMVSRVVVGGGRSMEIQLEQAMDRAKEQALSQSGEGPAGLGESLERVESSQKQVRQTPSLPPPPIRKSVESPQEKARRLFQLAREENLTLTWDECLASKALERARTLYEKGSLDHRDPASGKNPAFEMV